MPYITPERRLHLDTRLRRQANLGTRPASNLMQHPGELNYLISKLVIQYIEERGLDYQAVNDVEGVLGCFGQEFYRRVVAPYEDGKIASNGDVFAALIPETP